MEATLVMNAAVRPVFDGYPDAIRDQLLTLRQMIYDVAAEIEGVGELEETLKWGQISYLTPQTRSGTTIRIDTAPDAPEQIAMYVHCQTTLVETWRARYGDRLQFEGNRCVKFPADVAALPVEAVQDCIAMALTYHLNRQ